VPLSVPRPATTRRRPRIIAHPRARRRVGIFSWISIAVFLVLRIAASCALRVVRGGMSVVWNQSAMTTMEDDNGNDDGDERERERVT